MNIVVLDGYALNPGDLSWEPLKALGICTVYDRTPPELIVDRAREAEVLITNKTPLRAESFARLGALRYIGVLATGYNVVDTVAARSRGIPVSNIPDYGTQSVAQHVFALILELSQHVGYHASTVRHGEWVRNLDWCYWRKPLVELHGLTLGIVGYGRIGRVVAGIGRAFGMRVVACGRTPLANVEQLALDDLLRCSDVITLHCPLTPETTGLINAGRLALFKRSAFLINTARGALVVESDLATALAEGKLAGAAVDVLSSEPPSTNNPLLAARNCLITPHLAWATQAARRRLLTIATENVKAFATGTPQNVVN